MHDGEWDPQKTEVDFGQRVREFRLARHWTQKKLSEEIGIDASAVSRIEQGVRAVRLGEAAQLSRALGIDLDHLVFGQVVRPELWLERSRDSANRAMHELRTSTVEMADAYIAIARALSEYPQLFATLGDDVDGPPPKSLPKTLDEYFTWVERRIEAVFATEHSNRAYTPDGVVAQRISSLIQAVIRDAISTVPFPENEVEIDDADTPSP